MECTTTHTQPTPSRALVAGEVRYFVFLLLFTVLHYSKWQARKRLFQPVAMTAENEAINFFTSDDEDGGEGEGQGEEGEWC